MISWSRIAVVHKVRGAGCHSSTRAQADPATSAITARTRKSTDVRSSARQRQITVKNKTRGTGPREPLMQFRARSGCGQPALPVRAVGGGPSRRLGSISSKGEAPWVSGTEYPEADSGRPPTPRSKIKKTPGPRHGRGSAGGRLDGHSPAPMISDKAERADELAEDCRYRSSNPFPAGAQSRRPDLRHVYGPTHRVVGTGKKSLNAMSAR